MGPDTLDTDSRSSPSSNSLGDMLQCCSLQIVSLHARWYHCIRFPYCSTRTDHDQMRISLWVWRLQWTAARNSADWGGLPSLRFSPDLAETRLEQCIQSGQWITHGPGIDCGLAWSLDNNFSSELEKWFTWHSLELTQLSRFCSYWATRECPKYRGQGRASYTHFLVTSYQDSVLTGTEMARKSSIKLVQVMQFGKFDTRETSSKFELKFLFNRSQLSVIILKNVNH